MARRRARPRCTIIAGPNGAGKTTFARDYLPSIARLTHFINADLIAGGISPLQPELAAITAGRLVLRELDRLVAAKAEFAFESTLSGRHYAKRIEDWKNQGYLAGLISLMSIGRWQIIGQYMRIPNRNRNFWSAAHDHSS